MNDKTNKCHRCDVTLTHEYVKAIKFSYTTKNDSELVAFCSPCCNVLAAKWLSTEEGMKQDYFHSYGKQVF